MKFMPIKGKMLFPSKVSYCVDCGKAMISSGMKKRFFECKKIHKKYQKLYANKIS